MNGFGKSISERDNSVNGSVSDDILLSESFNRLVHKCENVIKDITTSTDNIHPNGNLKAEQHFFPLAKMTFNFQHQALQLLSWLKFVIRTTRSAPLNTQSIQSLLSYKSFMEQYTMREAALHRIHVYADQLSLVTRPTAPLSVSLPLIDDNHSTTSTAASNFPFSTRNVLNRCHVQLTKLVDAHWSRVGRRLRSSNSTVDKICISTNDADNDSFAVVSFTKRSRSLGNVGEPNLDNLPLHATHAALSAAPLQVEHRRLRRAGRRLADAQTLIAYCTTPSACHVWSRLPPDVVALLFALQDRHLEPLSCRIEQVWLWQLRLREIAKQAWDPGLAVKEESEETETNGGEKQERSDIEVPVEEYEDRRLTRSLPCLLPSTEDDHEEGLVPMGALEVAVSQESGFVSKSTCHSIGKHVHEHRGCKRRHFQMEDVGKRFRSASLTAVLSSKEGRMRKQPRFSEPTKNESSGSTSNLLSLDEATPVKFIKLEIQHDDDESRSCPSPRHPPITVVDTNPGHLDDKNVFKSPPRRLPPIASSVRNRSSALETEVTVSPIHPVCWGRTAASHDISASAASEKANMPAAHLSPNHHHLQLHAEPCYTSSPSSSATAVATVVGRNSSAATTTTTTTALPCPWSTSPSCLTSSQQSPSQSQEQQNFWESTFSEESSVEEAGDDEQGLEHGGKNPHQQPLEDTDSAILTAPSMSTLDGFEDELKGESDSDIDDRFLDELRQRRRVTNTRNSRVLRGYGDEAEIGAPKKRLSRSLPVLATVAEEDGDDGPTNSVMDDIDSNCGSHLVHTAIPTNEQQEEGEEEEFKDIDGESVAIHSVSCHPHESGLPSTTTEAMAAELTTNCGDTDYDIDSNLDTNQTGDHNRSWSPLSCRSEDLANLAAALRLSPKHSTTLTCIYQEGSEIIAWLTSLEEALFVDPSGTSSASYSQSCLRDDLDRIELDRCLDELDFYQGQLENWRIELDDLVACHKKRLDALEKQANKLFLSDHGRLVFISSWLNLLIQRRHEVENRLRHHLRVFDESTAAREESNKRLKELTTKVEQAITETKYAVDRLRSSVQSQRDTVPSIDSTIAEIPQLAEHLQDLLEGVNAMQATEKPFDDPVSTLRDRLRTAISRLQHQLVLTTVAVREHPQQYQQQQYPLPSIPPACVHPTSPRLPAILGLNSTAQAEMPQSPLRTRRRRPRGLFAGRVKQVYYFLLLFVLPIVCYGLTQPRPRFVDAVFKWFSERDSWWWWSNGILCFASVGSQSICITAPGHRDVPPPI